jgi:hypothetical protein
VPLRDPSPLRRQLLEAVEDPFTLIRLVISGLLIMATVVAVGLSLSGVAPRAWLVIGAIWAIYGLMHGLIDFLLEPLAEFLARTVTSVGLDRAGGGFSEVETLEAQGHLRAAADAYQLRAATPADRIRATLRRAGLLSGGLGQPEQAAAELEALRQDAPRLTAGDDILIGAALADLYEHRLAAPGKAMTELRRLIDQYPRSHHARRLRATLAALRQRHFGDPVTPEPRA